MKRVGILGGMSWESSALYYKWINQGVCAKTKAHNSAPILLDSINFQKMIDWKNSGDWNSISEYLSQRAQKLENAGADFIVIATNTMHKVAQDIQSRIQIPLLHLADATAKNILSKNVKKIALLGTAYTMEQDFYKDRLIKAGLEVTIPDENERTNIHNVIYNELCNGIVEPNSKQTYINICNNLVSKGADGIILGCTEITMLINQDGFDVPIFDTTRIHVDAIIKEIIGE